MSSLMDAVSAIFLDALGTDMTAMEEYFPFITKAFEIMQYTAWTLLFLITIWQLFRAFGGPLTEAENPWQLLARSVISAALIGYAKPIFSTVLDIARAPYYALMNTTMTASDFTFAGIENVFENGVADLVLASTMVGVILLIILMVALGWNYFKLLLEVVERYIVVGVLCYTSPLAYALGGSKSTNKVFQSWCRMIGSQLLLLVMNVWFLRGFSATVGAFLGNAGALSNGKGGIFLWAFCTLAFLKTAQKFDSYLASLGLSVAQTGGSMGMEMLMAARVISGFSGGRSAGSVFGGGAGVAGSAVNTAGGGGIMAGLASKFKGNSYVRDAVTEGGTRLGAGGSVGLVGRMFGGIAAKSGATLSGESISSVASQPQAVSGSIAGDIADRSLTNYMPHLAAAGNAPAAGGKVAGNAESVAASSIGAAEMSGNAAGTAFRADSAEGMAGVASGITGQSEGVPGSFMETAASSAEFAGAAGSMAGLSDDMPSVSSVDMADTSTDFPGLSGGMPEMPSASGMSFSDTQITGGYISTTAMTPDGKEASVDLYSASQYEKPTDPYSVVSASDGSQWYQVASGEGMGAFYQTPQFTGDASEAAQVASAFPGAAAGASLRTVDDGVLEASYADGGSSQWYSSAFYQEPDAPHETIRSSDGIGWYAMQPNAATPYFEPESGSASGGSPAESGAMRESVMEYNRVQFQNFMPGYAQPVSNVDSSRGTDGLIEVRHSDGTGTAFYDKTKYQSPRGDYKVYEDARGGQWYAVPGSPTVERRPVYDNGKPVYDGDKIRTVNVEGIRYKSSLTQFEGAKKRDVNDRKTPYRKR